MIVWFVLFHIGIDFWIFPNYFIDSNNPLDSFFPLLEVAKRDDMLDFRMAILRLASVAAIVFGANEWIKSENTMDDVINTFGDLSNDVFEWGQNKFLGIPDNSQAIQHKKSAREIFAEAFMEDETFTRNTQFVQYADEAELKEMYEKEKRAKEMAAAAEQEPQIQEEEEVDLLDMLTKTADDEEWEQIVGEKEEEAVENATEL